MHSQITAKTGCLEQITSQLRHEQFIKTKSLITDSKI